MTAPGSTGPRTWSPSSWLTDLSWLTDVVPHLARAFVTLAVRDLIDD